MSDAPLRIWASPEHPDENGYGGFWIASKVAPAVEYVRADEIERLQAELREAREVARKAQWALQPFSDCIYNDNGDLTVEQKVPSRDQLVDAHFAYKAARAFLAK